MDVEAIEQQALPNGTIRRARPAEADRLSALAFRSKAYWGYDVDFMEACRADLTVSADDLLAEPVYVLDLPGNLVGFYRLRVQGTTTVMLSDLFVEPDAIGQGYGKQLWQHAVATATDLGGEVLALQSDPQAEGFYRAMGAQRAGEAPSTVFPGLLLPFMRFSLRH
jgi:GNAT superfamily N-acetyltransferase